MNPPQSPYLNIIYYINIDYISVESSWQRTEQKATNIQRRAFEMSFKKPGELLGYSPVLLM